MEDRFAQFHPRLLQREAELVTDLERFDDRQPDVAEVQDVGDRAATNYNKDEMLDRIARDRGQLVLVRDALHRGEQGEFGACRNCGRQIEGPRLEAVPWTPYCVACQELADRGEL